jgi:transposase
MRTTTGLRWIGIDVGKATLDLASHPDGTAWQILNDAAGWQALVANCQATPPAGIVLEATGGYETGVVVALDAAGFTPVVANPIAPRRFAQSLGQRGKSDRLDAAMLAAYGARLQPVARPVPSETARQLQALIDRREQLTKQLVEEQNRLQQADAIVRDSLQSHLTWLRTARDEVTRMLAALVASDPFWQHRVALLETVPGMGSWTATVYAVELPELADRTGKQLASLVGVAPHPRESGRFRGQRFISGGRAHLRRAGYQAVHAAQRSRDPVLRSHVAQLMARGKSRKHAIVAGLRRLLGILHVMVRDDLTWDQTRVGKGVYLPPT